MIHFTHTLVARHGGVDKSFHTASIQIFMLLLGKVVGIGTHPTDAFPNKTMTYMNNSIEKTSSIMLEHILHQTTIGPQVLKPYIFY